MKKVRNTYRQNERRNEGKTERTGKQNRETRNDGLEGRPTKRKHKERTK